MIWTCFILIPCVLNSDPIDRTRPMRTSPTAIKKMRLNMKKNFARSMVSSMMFGVCLNATGSVCDDKFSKSLFETELNYASYDFNSHFRRGERTVLPSFKNLTNGEAVETGRHSQPVIRGVADFNLDGLDDLVVTFHETKKVAALLLADGTGRFKLNWLPKASESRLFREASIADFDSDGRPDIYGHTAPHVWKGKNIGGGGAAEADFLLLNKADGFTAIDMSKIVNGNNHQGAVADLDGNGILDVVSLDQRSSKGFNSAKKTFLYGQQDGGYRKGPVLPTEFQSSQFFDVEAGDLNGDGAIDLVFTKEMHHNDISIGSDPLVVIQINGSKGIEKGQTINLSSHWASGSMQAEFKNYSNCLKKTEKWGEFKMTKWGAGEIALFDFDNDGDLDIFFTQHLDLVHKKKKTWARGSKLSVLENEYPKFNDVSDSVIPYQPTNKVFTSKGLGRPLRISFADVNSDGSADLILSGIGAKYQKLEQEHYPYLFIWSNGQYLPVKREQMKDLEWRSQLVTGDFNGDGKSDLVSTRYARKSEQKYVFDTYLSK